ncbi:MAG: hypothetical protein HFH45_03445 [Bacilli bacterium]|nr:hypothetical protein [Bacilli bacterium]
MKYTIEGFSQFEVLELSKSMEIKIDVIDLVILRWIVDFYPNMEKKSIDGIEYAWVNYSYLLEKLPILNINKQNLYRRLKKLCDVQILEHKNVKDKGNFSYYKFGENYNNLISNKNDIPSVKNDLTFSQGRQNPYVKNDRTNINLTKDYSNKDYNNPIVPLESFEKFWKAYPKKQDKQKTKKWFEKNKPNEELLRTILDKLELFKKTKQWENKQFIPMPTTWLNGKRWEDEVIVEETETEEEMLARVKKEIEEEKRLGIW